ncbi:hypothetical protein [Rossellomorea vietnamensis]|uniref:Nephrocystin 3-like N-terminal domain-containing protein n=1 Tax=Rossellomorea vietnamensis TaxID=218284 RepID=A0A0P6VZW4_9BACI|nr:hypothetical protein [Rossellomorea vietnamensis]KPL60699.1 hypothetical protein AM506_04785 [Rossellomorea vietnamensis]
MNTNLIIIEGIPGSGKSTTANFIKEHLENEGVKVKLFQEGDTSHPADYESTACLNEGQFNNLLEQFPEQQESLKEHAEKKGNHYFISYRNAPDMESSPLFEYLASYDVYELDLDTFEEVAANYWKEFVEQAALGDDVYIFECCFLQNPFTKFIAMHNAEPKRLENYLKKIGSLISPLNPLLIYFYQDDVEQSFHHVYEERSQEWREFFTDYHVNQGYGKANGLKGYQGIVEYLEMRRNLEMKILEELPVRHMLIENGDKDWDTYYEKMKEAIK